MPVPTSSIEPAAPEAGATLAKGAPEPQPDASQHAIGTNVPPADMVPSDQSGVANSVTKTSEVPDPAKRLRDLEHQISGLTSKMKTMESDYSDQLRTLTEALARKSATVESTRLRASRLEFAQREAIHFLAKPLANSQDAIATQLSSVDIQLTECVRFALQYLRAAHKAVLDQQPVSPIMDTKGAPGPLGVAIEKATGAGGAGTGPPATPMEDNIPLSRLATSHAAATQSRVDSHVPPASAVTAASPAGLGSLAKGNSRSMSTPPGVSLSSAIMESTQEEAASSSTPDTPPSPAVHVSPASPKSSTKSPRPGHGHGKTRTAHYHSQAGLSGGVGMLGSPSVGASGNGSSHARSLSMSAAAHLLSRNVVASDPMGLSPRGEDDLGVTLPDSGPEMNPAVPPRSSRCDHCRTLALQLDAVKDALASATSKLTDVERTLDYERVLRSRVQIAKDLLETELEELTSQLFSEANRMVEEEAGRRDALESVNRGLARQLERMREDEVRRTLERAARTRKISSASGQPPAGLGSMSLGTLLEAAGGNPAAGGSGTEYAATSPGMVVDTQVYVDAVELNAFQDFVRRVTAYCPTAANSTSGGNNASTSSQTATVHSSSSHLLPHPTLTSFTSSSTSSAAAIAAAIAATGSIPWTAIDSDPLVKRCMSEDIEPCLFARTPHLHSSTNAAAALVSVGSSFKKRLLEALAVGNVDIVPVSRPGSPTNRDKSGGASGTSTKIKCSVCGAARTCGYSLRFNTASTSGSTPSSTSSTSSPTSAAKQLGSSTGLSLTASLSGFSSKLTSSGSNSSSPVATPGVSSDPSFFGNDAYPIDLFCRDRILAARDFYGWIRRLPTTMQTGSTPTPSGGTGAGASHRPPIVELFRVYLAHRRRMAEARVGSAGLFRDGGYGGVGDYANITISH